MLVNHLGIVAIRIVRLLLLMQVLLGGSLHLVARMLLIHPNATVLRRVLLVMLLLEMIWVLLHHELLLMLNQELLVLVLEYWVRHINGGCRLLRHPSDTSPVVATHCSRRSVPHMLRCKLWRLLIHHLLWRWLLRLHQRGGIVSLYRSSRLQASTCHGHILVLLNVDLFVLVKRQKHAIFPERYLQLIREVSEVIPLSHLLLLEWPTDFSRRILVKPVIIPALSGLARLEELQETLVGEWVRVESWRMLLGRLGLLWIKLLLLLLYEGRISWY